MDYNEFAEKIKAKYPDYKDMDNLELAQKIVSKYPDEYSDVTFDIENINNSPNVPLKYDKNGQAYLEGGIDFNIDDEYKRIQNDKNLTKEQKIQEIERIGKEQRSKIDADNFKKMAQLWGGEALQIGSAFIPAGIGGRIVASVGKPAIQAILRNIPGLMAGGAVGGLGEAIRTNKQTPDDYLKTIEKGALYNLAFGKMLQALGQGGKTIINSTPFKKAVSKTEELLTSVPAEYTERALEKELAGNSILRGKFDAKDLNAAYYNAGQKAINGFKNAELRANEEIKNALSNLPEDSINRENLINNIVKNIDEFANGGDINPALEEKGNDIYNYLGQIANTNKTVDIHNIKDLIQSQVKNQYGKESGAGVNALKQMGNTLKTTLENASPEYGLTNANRAALYDIRDLLGNLNKKTVASNLRNVETEAKLRSGYNEAAEVLDNLVEPQYKFLDEVKDLRAREALEQWYPGQYGGSGSSQGFGNLVRAAALGGSGVWSALTHNPATSFLSAGIMSPKIGAKGTIQNLGRLNKLYNGSSILYKKFEPWQNAYAYLMKKVGNVSKANEINESK